MNIIMDKIFSWWENAEDIQTILVSASIVMVVVIGIALIR